MIKTVLLDTADGRHFLQAAEVLKRGGLVAFPTETVYGLAADAMNEEAVRKVYKAKGRPPDNPLIIHVSHRDQLDDFGARLPRIGEELANSFWPGPITLVVRHYGDVPAIVTAGLPTVAVRMPNHPAALELITLFGSGIVGPSANSSGRPSATTAQHVIADLDGKIDVVLDAGPTQIGVESTVVDVTGKVPIILRPGGISRQQIGEVIGTVGDPHNAEHLGRSPGTRHRHYSPRAIVQIIAIGSKEDLVSCAQFHRSKHHRICAILHSADLTSVSEGIHVVSLRVDEYSHRLFELFRIFDAEHYDTILVEAVPDTGIGEAVMDRLRRASER